MVTKESITGLLNSFGHVARDQGIGKAGILAYERVTNMIQHQLLSRYNWYYALSREWYRRRSDFDIYSYNIEIDPFKIIWVDSDQIMNISARCWPRSYEFGQVKDGNWDTRDEFEFQPGYERKKWKQVDFGSLRFEQTMFFASAQRHYEDGVPWEETEYYQTAVDAMAEGTMIHDWITTEEGLQADLRNMDRLYDSISDSYNTQKTLLEEGKSDASSFAELRRNEIRVDISRSGELLFAGGGKHRLTLAKLLELDWVPVVIIVRHKEWVQALESRYCETENHAPDWEALHLEEAGKANVETVSV